jgi:hypothetical protein
MRARLPPDGKPSGDDAHLVARTAGWPTDGIRLPLIARCSSARLTEAVVGRRGVEGRGRGVVFRAGSGVAASRSVIE